MAQLTITKIYRSDKDKEGKPLLSKKDGRPYSKIALKTREYGEGRWVSGFGNQTNSQWKEGQTVEVEIEEKGEYLNFKNINKVDALEKRVEMLEAVVFKKTTQDNNPF